MKSKVALGPNGIGGFTLMQDDNIDLQLATQLKIAVEELVELFGTNCSVILAGGFGRGEGSVKLLEGKRVIPLHDFDIYVISEARIAESVLDEAKSRIGDEIGRRLKVDMSRSVFRVDIEVIAPEELPRLSPDLSSFELKEASKILYGPDKRALIPFKKSDITLASGAITLFHRAFALIRDVQPSYLAGFGSLSQEREAGLVYECCKVFTEICTSFSLLGGFYSPSYAERARGFANLYKQKFPKLWELSPSLASKVTMYTNAKLMSDFENLGDPIRLWLDTRSSFLPCFRIFMSSFLHLGYGGEDDTRYFKEMYKRLRTIFFREYLSHFLQLNGFRHKLWLEPAVLFSQIYDNVRYISIVRSVEGRYPSRFSLDWGSPMLRTCLSAILLLSAIEEGGNIREEYLDEADRILSGVYPLRPLHSCGKAARWSYLRDMCIRAHELYFLRKTGKIGASPVATLLKRR